MIFDDGRKLYRFLRRIRRSVVWLEIRNLTVVIGFKGML